MKKIKYLLPIILFSIFFNVKAIDSCTSEEMKRLRDLANKVEFKQDITIDSDDEDEDIEILYNLSFINFDDDLSIYMKLNGDDEFEKINFEDINDEYFFEGDIVTFKIYSYTTNLCTNELLRTINIKFDYYNYWYYKNKDNCQKYPEFKYCKEFMKVDKEDEKINKLFDEYIKEQNGTTSNVSNILSDYKYIIIGTGGIIIAGVVLFIILKRNKKEKI